MLGAWIIYLPHNQGHFLILDTRQESSKNHFDVLVFDPCYANVEDFDGHADFQFLPDRVVGETGEIRISGSASVGQQQDIRGGHSYRYFPLPIR